MSADDPYAYAESIVIDASPQQVYDLVSDVTRVGEWSPVCDRCEWLDGDAPGADGPRVGARFTGYNSKPDRDWTTTSEVVVAEPGREFAWEVNGGYVRWGYVLSPADGGGVRLTESWEFRESGRAFFHEKWGPKADAAIAARVQDAHEGIPTTLATLKRIAEA